MSEVIAIDRREFAAALKAADGNLKKVSVPRALSNHPSVEEWAEIIGSDFRRSVEATIAAGRHLREAKDQLDDERGEFLQLLDRIGIHETTACKLMRIAAHPIISNFSHVKKLPLAWGTLYELTTLPTDVLEAKLADGTVTPEMEREDVVALKATLKGQERQSRSKQTATQRGNGRRVAELEAELEALRARVAELESRGTSQPRSARISANQIVDLTEADMRRRREEMDLLESLGQMTFGPWRRCAVLCPAFAVIDGSGELGGGNGATAA
jgi:hypothetical protein